MSVVRIRLWVLLVWLFLTVVVWALLLQNDTSAPGELQVTFLDVGQGDAIYIRTPDGAEALIDGGQDAAVLRQLAKERAWLDRSLDLVVSTHPDLDHVAGLVDVLDRFAVDVILLTENTGETTAAGAFLERAEREEAALLYARAGQVLALGASTTIRVLSPTGSPVQLESNASSIVLQVVYGETEFLLTGDAPAGLEEYLVVRDGEALASEVLKLGHHGSKTSSSEQFLAVVDPEYAVVSAGADNRYGHPHAAVVERVVASGAELLETKEGSVRLLSDGKRVWVQ